MNANKIAMKKEPQATNPTNPSMPTKTMDGSSTTISSTSMTSTWISRAQESTPTPMSSSPETSATTTPTPSDLDIDAGFEAYRTETQEYLRHQRVTTSPLAWNSSRLRYDHGLQRCQCLRCKAYRDHICINDSADEASRPSSPPMETPSQANPTQVL